MNDQQHAKPRVRAPWISKLRNQFSFFAHQLGEWDWHGRKVLDFGGNVGNMLADPASTIDHENYWCLDIEAEPLEMGRRTYPRAHWVRYDRYSFRYNPGGVRGLPVPVLGPAFDYILAYSIFTNTSQEDMLDLVADLRQQLADGGRLAFTFMDPEYCPLRERPTATALRNRLEEPFGGTEGLDVEGMLARVEGADWCLLVNDALIFPNGRGAPEVAAEEQESYFTFYTERYIRSLFPDVVIRPPVGNQVHHCAILGR